MIIAIALIVTLLITLMIISIKFHSKLNETEKDNMIKRRKLDDDMYSEDEYKGDE